MTISAEWNGCYEDRYTGHYTKREEWVKND